MAHTARYVTPSNNMLLAYDFSIVEELSLFDATMQAYLCSVSCSFNSVIAG